MDDSHQTTTLAPPNTDGVRAAWDEVRGIFTQAASDPVISERFGTAKCVTVMRARSVPDEPMVIDARNGLEIDTVDEDAATATVELGDQDVRLLAEGTLRPAMAITAGTTTYRGPVREFLRVLPTVQAIACPPSEVGQAHDDE